MLVSILMENVERSQAVDYKAVLSAIVSQTLGIEINCIVFRRQVHPMPGCYHVITVIVSSGMDKEKISQLKYRLGLLAAKTSVSEGQIHTENSKHAERI